MELFYSNPKLRPTNNPPSWPNKILCPPGIHSGEYGRAVLCCTSTVLVLCGNADLNPYPVGRRYSRRGAVDRRSEAKVRELD